MLLLSLSDSHKKMESLRNKNTREMYITQPKKKLFFSFIVTEGEEKDRLNRLRLGFNIQFWRRRGGEERRKIKA